MNRIIFAVVMGLAVVSLAGCSSNDGPYGGHTAAWYSKHIKQAKEEMKWCNNHIVNIKHHNSAFNSCRNAFVG